MSELSASAITQALATRRLGRPTLVFSRIGSTNDVAHEQAAAGAPDGLLVIADEQTTGRGRLDRRWWAPPGTCLLLSLLLRPGIPLWRAGQLTMCLGLGTVEGIAEVTGVHARLKWPNDIILDGRKLGGMLTELCAEGDRLDYAVLGLGINVNVRFGGGQRTIDHGRWTMIDSPPSEIVDTATSLLMVLERPVDRLALLAAILTRAETWIERMQAGESPHAAWTAQLDTLGRQVTVALAAGTLQGIAAGVTPEGALIIQDSAGVEHVVWTGDVTRVR